MGDVFESRSGGNAPPLFTPPPQRGGGGGGGGRDTVCAARAPSAQFQRSNVQNNDVVLLSGVVRVPSQQQQQVRVFATCVTTDRRGNVARFALTTRVSEATPFRIERTRLGPEHTTTAAAAAAVSPITGTLEEGRQQRRNALLSGDQIRLRIATSRQQQRKRGACQPNRVVAFDQRANTLTTTGNANAQSARFTLNVRDFGALSADVLYGFPFSLAPRPNQTVQIGNRNVVLNSFDFRCLDGGVLFRRIPSAVPGGVPGGFVPDPPGGGSPFLPPTSTPVPGPGIPVPPLPDLGPGLVPGLVPGGSGGGGGGVGIDPLLPPVGTPVPPIIIPVPAPTRDVPTNVPNRPVGNGAIGAPQPVNRKLLEEQLRRQQRQAELEGTRTRSAPPTTAVPNTVPTVPNTQGGLIPDVAVLDAEGADVLRRQLAAAGLADATADGVGRVGVASALADGDDEVAGLSVGAWVGVAIAAIALLALVAGLIYYFVVKRQKQEQQEGKQQQTATEQRSSASRGSRTRSAPVEMSTFAGSESIPTGLADTQASVTGTSTIF